MGEYEGYPSRNIQEVIIRIHLTSGATTPVVLEAIRRTHDSVLGVTGY